MSRNKSECRFKHALFMKRPIRESLSSSGWPASSRKRRTRQAGTNALIAKRAAALARLDGRVTTAREEAQKMPGKLAPVLPRARDGVH